MVKYTSCKSIYSDPCQYLISYSINSQDLINPGCVIKSSLSLIDSQMLVTDLAGLYSDGVVEIPKAVKVLELEMKLKEEVTNEFCLHKYQRLAVARALTQPLSLIQVCTVYTLLNLTPAQHSRNCTMCVPLVDQLPLY